MNEHYRLVNGYKTHDGNIPRGFFDVFVFGSNTEGIHGAGAARHALLHYGAQYGQAMGFQGNSYAIVTKDLSLGDRSVPLSYIEDQVKDFLCNVLSVPEYAFWVTAIGCGLAGFKAKEIAPFFKKIPNNVVLPIEFSNELPPLQV